MNFLAKKIEISDSQLQVTLRFLSDFAGFVFPEERVPEVEKSLKSNILKYGYSSSDDCFREFPNNEDFINDLADSLRIGETYFFRIPQQFDYIREVIIPSIDNEQQVENSIIKFWCAGCSTGEEPYTMAMMLNNIGRLEQSMIIGTDISQSSLIKAKAGVYREWSFRGVSKEIKEKYFSEDKKNNYTLSSLIKRNVKFDYLNLASSPYPSIMNNICDLNVIFCRNVLIYFDSKTISNICKKMYESLLPGGFLVTAPTDPDLSEYYHFEKNVIPEVGAIYKKPRKKIIIAKPVDLAIAKPIAKSTQFKDEKKIEEAILSKNIKNKKIKPQKNNYELALEAFKIKDYEKSERLLTSSDSSLEEAVLLGKIIVKKSRKEEVLPQFDKLFARHETSSELYLIKSMFLLSQNDFDDALSFINKVIFLEPFLEIAHYVSGIINLKVNKNNVALKSFENALKLCEKKRSDEILKFCEVETAGEIAKACQMQIEFLRSMN